MPKKTFDCAESVGAILITQAKGNQKTLKEQLAHGCRRQKPISILKEALDKAHGRLEQRTYEVFSAHPMLEKWKDEWPFIRQVVRVTRYREEIRKGKPEIYVTYYVSNGILTADEYAKYIREHWLVENKLHYVKDVAFKEDSKTKHRNPYIYSMCIDMALNILREKGTGNISNEIYKNSLDFNKFFEQFKEFFCMTSTS